jgi:ABC-2 type transport system permease protein
VRRVLVIVRKEWADVRQNRLLLLSMAWLPLVMVVVPLGMIFVYRRLPPNSGYQALASYYAPIASGTDSNQILIEMTVKNWLGLFLILPVFIPVMLAAHSVAGEKERRTIEPLFAAPVTDLEIILAKTIAAVIPGMLITWMAFAIFVVGVDVLAYPKFGRLILPDRLWLFANFVIGPLLSFFGNCLAVAVSFRVGDARLAQQLSAVVVLPFVAIVIAGFSGFFFIGSRFYLVLAPVVALLDIGMLRLALWASDRERVLTRWS